MTPRRTIATAQQLVEGSRRHQPRPEPSEVAAAYIFISALIGCAVIGVMLALLLIGLQDTVCKVDDRFSYCVSEDER
jgi:hypothetical protein